MALLFTTGVFGAASPVFSQDAINEVANDNTMVKGVPQFSGLSNEMVNQNAQKDFKKKFAGVNDEKWFKNKDHYISQFTNDNTRFKIEYDSKGKWTGTQKSYPGIKLAHDGRTLIKNNFFGYDVVWVTEFSLPGFYDPVYIVRIENSKAIKSVCINDGEIKVLEEYPKAQLQERRNKKG